SASSSALRTSRRASRTFSSLIRPRPERLRNTPPNLSLSVSSMGWPFYARPPTIPTGVDDIAEQLAARDRLRRKLALQKTPEQRMADMARLQAAMWAALQRSPEGYARFMRRNFKARAIAVPPDRAG